MLALINGDKSGRLSAVTGVGTVTIIYSQSSRSFGSEVKEILALPCNDEGSTSKVASMPALNSDIREELISNPMTLKFLDLLLNNSKMTLKL